VSYFDTAGLLRLVVNKLRPTGCLLTGDEIAEKLKNVNVIYGVRTPVKCVEGSDVRHVDVIEQDEGWGCYAPNAVERYDG